MKKKTAPMKVATRTAKQAAKPSARVNGHESVQDIQVRIAARAHELYVQRGCLDGYHLHDWLEAEQEMVERAPASATSSARI